MTDIISSLSEISRNYDAVFCDVWGCYHNGVAPLKGAVSALRAFRGGGGTVILLTNAPRPEVAVKRSLLAMGAPEDSWDAIASSGGAAHEALRSGSWGEAVYHIGGAERDAAFFDGVTARRVPLDKAQSLVCTGLVNDETESPDDYRDLLREAALRKLPMLCANPDIIVDVGEQRRWCAGALAALYRELGGEVTEYGKPYPQIYDYARAVLTKTTGKVIPDERILCIGDGVKTDIAGAMGEGLDALFIAAGLAGPEMGADPAHPEPELLTAYLGREGAAPRYSTGFLK